MVLLALGQRHLELGQTAFVPEQLQRDDRATVALDGADQLVDLLALQEQLPVTARLVVETVGRAVSKFAAMAPAVMACEATNSNIALLVGSDMA